MEGSCLRLHAIIGRIITISLHRIIVFNPTIAVETWTIVLHKEVLTLVCPKGDIALSVECYFLLTVRIGITTIAILRCVKGISLCVINLIENLCALCQLLLELSDRIITIAPVRCLLRIKSDIEEEFLTCKGCRVIIQVNGFSTTSSAIQLLNNTILYRLTVGKEGPLKIELVEVAVEILIRQLHLTAVFIQIEAHPLVNTLHLIEFSTPCTVGIDKSVVNEVILMRTRTVKTCDISRESILCQLVVLNRIIRVDTLIHPVPDTTTNTHLRAFDSLPVLTKVAHSVTHSMGILAHEIRFTRTWMVSI